MDFPSREDISNLKVGDIAPSSFGPKKVVEISYRGLNINDKAYVGYRVELSAGFTLSHSLTEDKISRDLLTTKAFNSFQLDQIEKAHQPA